MISLQTPFNVSKQLSTCTSIDPEQEDSPTVDLVETKECLEGKLVITTKLDRHFLDLHAGLQKRTYLPIESSTLLSLGSMLTDARRSDT